MLSIRFSKAVPEKTQHQLGQWFTPEPVADLALALALRGAGDEVELLDPSCGDGVFLRRAAKLGMAEQRLCGVDIDVRAISAAKEHVPRARLVHGDFFAAHQHAVNEYEVIVGNPPYVRQERLGAEAKAGMVERLTKDWPQLDRRAVESLIGRSDLAAPFLLRTLRHLRKGGTAALVISSAFLDSGYGAQFWQLLGQVASLRMLVDAPQERWFQDAAVNAVIAVFKAAPSSQEVCLARLHTSTSRAASVIAGGGELGEVADLRFAPSAAPETWAASLRAPDAWFRFVSAAGGALTTLGELAEIRRGITSGANDIFYLRSEEAHRLSLPPEFLQPLLRAPGKAGQGEIFVNHENCGDCALVVPPQTELADHPSLARYLLAFPGAESRSTLASRDPWWALQPRQAQVFLSKAYAARFVQPYALTPMVADQRIYCVHPKHGLTPDLLSALLNATTTALALESLGRASMGEGALEWTVADARQLPLLDPRQIENRDSVLPAFAKLGGRAIGSVASEAMQDDRREFDDVLLASWPELRPMREELHSALVESCAARQRRAKAS